MSYEIVEGFTQEQEIEKSPLEKLLSMAPHDMGLGQILAVQLACAEAREQLAEKESAMIHFLTTPLSAFGNISAIEFLKTCPEENPEEFVRAILKRALNVGIVEHERQLAEKDAAASKMMEALAWYAAGQDTPTLLTDDTSETNIPLPKGCCSFGKMRTGKRARQALTEAKKVFGGESC